MAVHLTQISHGLSLFPFRNCMYVREHAGKNRPIFVRVTRRFAGRAPRKRAQEHYRPSRLRHASCAPVTLMLHVGKGIHRRLPCCGVPPRTTNCVAVLDKVPDALSRPTLVLLHVWGKQPSSKLH